MTLEERLQRLEYSLRNQRRMNLVLLVLLGIGVSAVSIAAVEHTTFALIRTKGIIVEDQQGRPRIVLGAPLDKIPGRERADPIEGIVYLDPNGRDRLTFGKSPDPMTSGGIAPRRTGGIGVLIHDRQGIERGGYGVLDDDTATLTLDWPKSGEGVALTSSPDFSGVGLFYKSEPGVYRDSVGMFTFAKGDKVLLKLTDIAGNPRSLLSYEGVTQPRVQRFDATGKELPEEP